MSEEPKIRVGSRVVVARLYGPGMPECCVSDGMLRKAICDKADLATVVRVDEAVGYRPDEVRPYGDDVPIAMVVFDSLADDQVDQDGDGMPPVFAWLIPVACLREVPDERTAALEAEVAELRAQFDKLWDEVNSFVHDEPCPVCGDGPEPVRRWLHDGDRVDCVCGHEGRVEMTEDGGWLEWDEVDDG